MIFAIRHALAFLPARRDKRTIIHHHMRQHARLRRSSHVPDLRMFTMQEVRQRHQGRRLFRVQKTRRKMHLQESEIISSE